MKTMIKKNLRGALLISSLAIVGTASAAAVEEEEEKEDNRPPIGCYDKGYQFELTTLQLMPGDHNDNQSMYFLFNQLNQPITLYQMRNEESSRSMYLNHGIGVHQWAVLSTNERRVKFICTVPAKKLQYGQIVDCAKSLRVCEYTNVRYGLNNRGNYWLLNSNTRGGAVSAVVHYGIIPGQ
jgi:hypothetical protein